MTTKPAAVQVLTVTATGIRAKVYGKDYSYNAANNSFFIAQDGKWVQATPNTLHQTILRDRHAQYVQRQAQSAFIAKNPNYQTSKERYARAVGDNGSHRDYS
jgi:Fe-S cluster assembly iron-binding protein IscA